MGKHDEGAAGSMGEPASTVTGLDAIGLEAIVIGMVRDLELLRAGAITIPMARARTQMAHEILRGVHLVIQGQKIIEGRAIPLPSPDKGGKRKNGKVIDAQ